MAADLRVLAGGRSATYEERVTSAADDSRWYLSTKGPLASEDGTVIGLYGIARDITERRRAEEALRASEALHHAVFDGLSMAYLRSSQSCWTAPDASCPPTRMRARSSGRRWTS